ncbi:hypothetical protein ACFQ1L_30280 [Phytohabitans flavus]|uniref:hypothetical protein n=1 Tax=Phytohabitans flavus TaxID=1076124 RepID=UPI00362C8261
MATIVATVVAVTRRHRPPRDLTVVTFTDHCSFPLRGDAVAVAQSINWAFPGCIDKAFRRASTSASALADRPAHSRIDVAQSGRNGGGRSGPFGIVRLPP